MTHSFRRTRWLLLGLVLLLPVNAARAQILNTLRGFEPDEPGWTGELGAAFSASGGNTENISLGANGSLQWLGSVHRLRLLMDAAWEESMDRTTEEEHAVHLRHNARLGPALSSLALVQQQRNRFQRLESRVLIGAGGRWDVIRGENIRGSWGLSPMLEVEKIRDAGSTTRGRLSTFVTLLGKVGERTAVDLTGFFQPGLADFSDSRAVGLAALRVGLSERVSLVWSGRLEYDAEPAPGVDNTDWKTQTGIAIRL